MGGIRNKDFYIYNPCVLCAVLYPVNLVYPVAQFEIDGRDTKTRYLLHRHRWVCVPSFRYEMNDPSTKISKTNRFELQSVSPFQYNNPFSYFFLSLEEFIIYL